MRRRRFLGGLALGTAGLATAPARAGAHADHPSASDDSPSLWPLFAPLSAGSAVGLGWRLVSLSDARRGMAVLKLERSGHRATVHLAAREGRARGVASSALVDFVLMNGADGTRQTDENLGRVIKSLAKLVAQNETVERVEAAGLLPHRSASPATTT